MRQPRYFRNSGKLSRGHLVTIQAFKYAMAIMRSLNISWHGMFLIYAFITTASAIWLFRTFSPDFTTAYFIFLCNKCIYAYCRSAKAMSCNCDCCVCDSLCIEKKMDSFRPNHFAGINISPIYIDVSYRSAPDI